MLFRAGEEGCTFYVVVRGSVDILSSNQDMDGGEWIPSWRDRPKFVRTDAKNVLVTLTSGKSFGENALSGKNSKRTASAVRGSRHTNRGSASGGGPESHATPEFVQEAV